MAWIFFLKLTATGLLRNDCGIEATATPLPAEHLLSLGPQQPDAPMKVIGPLVGHGRFELGCWGWGVGACPHELVYLLTGWRLRPARSGIFAVDLALAAASLLACIARHSPWVACEPG